MQTGCDNMNKISLSFLKRSITLLPPLLLASQVMASELVYTPVNPSFNPASTQGSYLLESAAAQNKLKDSSSSSRLDPMDNFKDSLNRMILNNLAQKIVSGTIESGNTMLDGVIVSVDKNTKPGIVIVTITEPTKGTTTLEYDARLF